MARRESGRIYRGQLQLRQLRATRPSECPLIGVTADIAIRPARARL
jgi:hypothetical protein